MSYSTPTNVTSTIERMVEDGSNTKYKRQKLEDSVSSSLDEGDGPTFLSLKRPNLEENCVESAECEYQKVELRSEENNSGENTSLLSTFDEDITDENSLDTFVPVDFELLEAVSNLADGKCGCTRNYIDEKCIEKSISLWQYDDVIICRGCFENQENQMGHRCTTWDFYEVDWEKCVREALLSKERLNELFEIYTNNHENINIQSNKNNFNMSLQCLLNRNIGNILFQLCEKDRDSYYRLNSGNYYKCNN